MLILCEKAFSLLSPGFLMIQQALFKRLYGISLGPEYQINVFLNIFNLGIKLSA